MIFKIAYTGELRGELIRSDGTHRTRLLNTDYRAFSIPFTKQLYARLKREIPFIAGMSLAAFLAWLDKGNTLPLVAIVTSVGVNYEMAAFASGVNPLTNFKYHDTGTDARASGTGDTGLYAAIGIARVAGNQTNPTAPQYATSATIQYNGSFSVTEWGLFSATSGGTLWDRRTFTAWAVNATDQIAYTYTLTGTAGGS
jgi:hypothetical protein